MLILTRFSTLLVLPLFLLLSACAPMTVSQLVAESDAKQVDAGELLLLARENTFHLSGPGIDAHFYFDESGYVFARDIYNNKSTGVWDVSDEAEICFKMKDWWEGMLRCFTVYRSGAKYYLFNNANVLVFTGEHLTGDAKGLYHVIKKSKKTFLREQKREQPPAAVPAGDDPVGPVAGSETLRSEPAPEELKSTVRMMARDCPDCDLSGADLRGADLIGANLEEANLSGADLSRANLRRANLKGANLENADLSFASMPGADLRDSNLRGAKLRGANLIRARLNGAGTEGANFEGALLEGVEGLEQ